MIALAGLIFLPTKLLLLLGIVIVAGHNVLDGFRLNEESPFYLVWAVLYQREVIDFNSFLVRTSYPILPWIGVIALGFVAGPWFRDEVSSSDDSAASASSLAL